MAFVVQNITGTQALANAYITVAEFKAYHDDRGNVYTNTSALIEKAIVKATDHIDTRWRFQGELLEDDQTTQWPRENAFDRNGLEAEGIPVPIKNACAEYALRAMTQVLEPDQTSPTGGLIKSTRSKVDVIEDETVYQDGASPGRQLAAWPAADRIINASGLAVGAGSGGGRVVR